MAGGVAIFLPVEQATGKHVVSLVFATGETASDGNDFHHVMLLFRRGIWHGPRGRCILARSETGITP